MEGRKKTTYTFQMESKQTIELLKWKLPRTRWIANTSPAGWIAGCPRKATNSLQALVQLHQESSVLFTMVSNAYDADLLYLYLSCPVRPLIPSPHLFYGHVHPLPHTLLLLNPNDPLFISIGGEALLQFSFILFLLLFLWSKFCSLIPSGLLFQIFKSLFRD